MIGVFSLLTGAAWGAPWSLDAAGRLTGVGFTPSVHGGGVEVGAAARLAGGERLTLAAGPRLALDTTAMLGTPAALLAAIELRAQPASSVWVDVRLAAGGESSALPAGWEFGADGALAAAPARWSAPAGRVALSLAVGAALPSAAGTLRPYLRYEEALVVGYAPASGIPLLVRGSVAAGLAVDLAPRSDR